MKFTSARSTARRRLALSLVALWLAAASLSHAEDFSWHNPWGTITIFGSGDRATFLKTDVAVGDATGANLLNYLDATDSPAVALAEAGVGSESATAKAQLLVNESETTGLPFTEGSIDFTNTGTGTGTGEIKLFFLINVPDPALISLTGLRSAITTTGSLNDAFSLALFQSDATGAKIGTALFSFSGNNFDQEASYQSTVPYYLLEMDVAAQTTSASSDAVTFSFAVNLAEVTPVPEPNTVALLALALSGLAICHFRKRSGRQGVALAREGDEP